MARSTGTSARRSTTRLGRPVVARRIRPDDALVEWLRAHSLGAVVRRLRSLRRPRSGLVRDPGHPRGARPRKGEGDRARRRLRPHRRRRTGDRARDHAPHVAGGSRRRGARRTGATQRRGGRRAAGRPGAVPRAPRDAAARARGRRDHRGRLRGRGPRGGHALRGRRQPVRRAEPAAPLAARRRRSRRLAPAVAAAVEAARSFEWSRQETAASEVERLDATLPLRQLTLPQLDVARVGLAEVERLADVLLEEILALEDVS